jgi:hypothetical protein
VAFVSDQFHPSERTACKLLGVESSSYRAMDFIVDGLATGRMVRILRVLDAYMRECLALRPTPAWVLVGARECSSD